MKLRFRLIILAFLSLLAIPAVADSVVGTIRTIDYNTTNGDIRFVINKAGTPTEVMRLKGATSNVAIGTTGSTARLSVVMAADDASAVLSTPSVSVGGKAGLEFNFSSGTGGNANNVARITGVTRSGGGGDLFFETAPSSAGSYTPKMSVLRAGGVGVGTTAPVSAFDVAGSVSLGTYGGVTAAPTNGLIVSGNVGIGKTVPANALDVTGSGSFSGNVGVGTTAPGHLLEVKTASAENGIIIDAATFPEIQYKRAGTLKGSLAIAGTAGGFFTGSVADSLIFQSEASALHLGSGTGAPALTVTSGNRIAIGAVASSSKVGIVMDADGGTIVTGTPSGGVGGTSGIEFNFSGGTGGNSANVARIMGSTASGGGGDILLQTAPSNTGAYVTQARVNKAGGVTIVNVGGNTPHACKRRSNSSLGTTTLTVTCSAGEIAVGGGCRSTGPSFIGSFPDGGTSTPPSQWTCETAAPAVFDVFVVCCDY